MSQLLKQGVEKHGNTSPKNVTGGVLRHLRMFPGRNPYGNTTGGDLFRLKIPFRMLDGHDSKPIVKIIVGRTLPGVGLVALIYFGLPASRLIATWNATW